MLSNKSLRIAGAAMLGTVAFLGTNAANATIDLDMATGGVIYAKETLATMAADTATHYLIKNDSDVLEVSAMTGIAGEESNRVVATFVLTGLVFTSTSGLKLDGSGVTWTTATGGDKGDSIVVFTGTRGTNGGKKDDVLKLTIVDLGIMPDAEDAGTIQMTFLDRNVKDDLTDIPGIENPGQHTVTYPGAIAVANAFKETPKPENLVAKVARRFADFGLDTKQQPVLQGVLGGFDIEATTTMYKASSGKPVTLEDLITVGDNKVDMTVEGEGSVMITGNFKFAERVALVVTAKDCAATKSPSDLRKVDTQGMVTDTEALKPQTPGFVEANSYLCIFVKESTDEIPVRIPAAGPYMVKTTYKSGTGGAAFPPPGGTYELGVITRNGTTVNFPFLTSQSRYNQVLRVTNRGGDASYTFSSDAMDDETDGTLMGGMTTQLLIRNLIGDGVGGTSGTLIIESEPRNIDVAIVHVNRHDSSTDTVIYPTP